jgi:hypothetical protein
MKVNIQFGELLSADFKTKTLTFLMKEELTFPKGKYAIVPINQYAENPTKEQFINFLNWYNEQKYHADVTKTRIIGDFLKFKNT